MREPNILTVVYRLDRAQTLEIRKTYPLAKHAVIDLKSLPHSLVEDWGLHDMICYAMRAVRPTSNPDAPDLMTQPQVDLYVDANNMLVIQFSADSERVGATDAFKIPASAVEGNTWVH